MLFPWAPHQRSWWLSRASPGRPRYQGQSATTTYLFLSKLDPCPQLCFLHDPVRVYLPCKAGPTPAKSRGRHGEPLGSRAQRALLLQGSFWHHWRLEGLPHVSLRAAPESQLRGGPKPQPHPTPPLRLLKRVFSNHFPKNFRKKYLRFLLKNKFHMNLIKENFKRKFRKIDYTKFKSSMPLRNIKNKIKSK